MKQLLEQLEAKMDAFKANAIAQHEKGNKAAGLRARRISLDLEPLLKRFRKLSLAASEDKKHRGKEAI